MTIAELHGKVSREGTNLSERLEDLLTSDVFGALLYAEAWDVLCEWFSRGENLIGQALTEVFPALCQVKKATMVFWPSGGLHKREPDVALRLVGKDDESYGISVEAKYLSPKSNREIKTDDAETQKTSPVPVDQLAAQWCQIQARVPEAYGWGRIEPGNRALFFVTAHPECPITDLEETVDNLGDQKQAAMPKCFWLGWCHLYPVLEEQFRAVQGDKPPCSGRALLLYHLLKLLERKRLRAFRGFRECIAHWMGLEATRGEPCFWTDRFFEFLKAEDEVVFEPPIFWRESNE